MHRHLPSPFTPARAPPPPPHTHTQKKKKKKRFFFQIRISCQFIEKHPPQKKMDSLSKKNHLPLPPPPLAQTTHTSPPPHPFFSDLDYLPTWFSVREFFYKLTKNPNLKQSFFGGGGEGCCSWGSEHNVQMFQMALLHFREYKLAKLVWNTCLNTEEMAQTSPIYDHFIIWPSSVSLTFNLSKQVF